MKALRYESINNIFSNAEKLKLIPDICIFKDSTEKSYDVMAMQKKVKVKLFVSLTFFYVIGKCSDFVTQHCPKNLR